MSESGTQSSSTVSGLPGFPDPSVEKKVYKARCHCGDVRFTVATAPLETGETKVTKCNCSICTKRGYLHIYPFRTDVKFLRGEDKLVTYTFGNGNIQHRFCPTCGIHTMVDFENFPFEAFRDKYSVNVRMSRYTGQDFWKH